MSDITRGFDVDSYNKPNFNFDAAFNEGYGTAIVKLGGNNLSGNQPYRMNGYPGFANKQAKFPIRGAYWVTGGSDPYRAAVFYAQNRAPWTNLDILDNEKLDSGNPWNDSQACVFWDTLASFSLPNYNPWQYGSRDALWKSWGPWPGSQARNIRALIAFYNGAPLSNINPGNYPAGLVKGHQWSSSVTIGGNGNIDANAFTSDAFSGIAERRRPPMAVVFTVPDWNGQVYIAEQGRIEYITDPQRLNVALIFATGRLNAADICSIGGGDIQALLDEMGMGDFTAQQVHDLPNTGSKFIVASWLDVSKAPSARVDEKILAEALVAAGIGGTTPEQIKQITDAIAASQKAVVDSIPTTFTAGKVS